MHSINAAMWIINNQRWGEWVTQNQVYKEEFCLFFSYFWDPSSAWNFKQNASETHRSVETDCCVSAQQCFNYELSARQRAHTHTHYIWFVFSVQSVWWFLANMGKKEARLCVIWYNVKDKAFSRTLIRSADSVALHEIVNLGVHIESASPTTTCLMSVLSTSYIFKTDL